ncbi:MAG TPA: tetratricopeptide repeat protein [Candidatus Aquilonibacter sp.]|nr:tetratricopeptide repeat protein [Candidatus Aquilonibacter sp.]
MARGTGLEIRPLTYEFGEFTLDVARGCLLRGPAEIKLRPKVYEALKYLVENAGRLISKPELIQAIWPESFVTDDSLVQCTVELRRALNDRDQRILKTVPRRGYQFTAYVMQHSAQPEAASPPGAPGVSTQREKLPTDPAAARRIELPTSRTSLVGRDREIAEVCDLLLRQDIRLLNLTGAGGAGKTRLAVAAASAVSDDFTAGVQFVGLASITRPDLAASAIAKALGIQQAANRAVPELIAQQLEDQRPFLLLLDNFEQVLPAASIVAEMLTLCPSLKVLATSRARLRIYGEQEFPVSPLAQDWAMELFTQRAAAVRPNFAASAENSAAVREICARLDGLPLAIELAAARTKVLSPNAILERLKSRLQLLTGGALDLPERQQTLRKTIDWSYDLLSEAEQRLFRRFSVFTGGGTLEAAEAVCNTARDLESDPLEGLSSLVDKNLVQRIDCGDGEARFTMLETIREYAIERLGASREDASVRRAHAAYCLVLAEEGNPELSPLDRGQWLARCDLEIDNFRAALDWLFENQQIEWALRVCTALFRFWEMREHLAEGRARLETALRMAGSGYERERAKHCLFLGALSTAQGDFAAAKIFIEGSLRLYESMDDRWGVAASLNALAVSARDRGDYRSSQDNFERSLECWRTLSDPLSTARCLHNLANVVKVLGDYPRALAALREAAVVFEQLGDRSGAAWSINQQGDIALEQGDMDGAREAYERALAAFRDAGDRWGAARSLTDLGHIYSEQGAYEAAHANYREALEAFANLGHRRGVARAMEGFACLAAAQKHARRALRLAAAAAHLRRLIGASLPPAEQAKLDRSLASAWGSLSAGGGKDAWTEGAGMNLAQAIEYCMEEAESARRERRDQ